MYGHKRETFLSIVKDDITPPIAREEVQYDVDPTRQERINEEALHRVSPEIM